MEGTSGELPRWLRRSHPLEGDLQTETAVVAFPLAEESPTSRKQPGLTGRPARHHDGSRDRYTGTGRVGTQPTRGPTVSSPVVLARAGRGATRQA